MAPELVTGENVDARSDLFAAGAILFEMLAARPAFEGRTIAEVVHAIVYEQPPALGGSPAVAAIDPVHQLHIGPGGERPFIVPLEQCDHVRNLRCGSHWNSDPPGLWKDVMRPGPSLGNELVADSARERQVGDRCMQMPELFSTKPKLNAAEPVIMCGDACPAANGGPNSFDCGARQYHLIAVGAGREGRGYGM
jgi:hypothetical protein